METNEKKLRLMHWARIVEECNKSGIKKKDWMKEHGINSKSFYRYQQKLRESISTKIVNTIENEAVTLPLPVSSINETAIKRKEQSPEEICADVVIKVRDISIALTNHTSDELFQKVKGMLLSYAE